MQSKWKLEKISLFAIALLMVICYLAGGLEWFWGLLTYLFLLTNILWLVPNIGRIITHKRIARYLRYIFMIIPYLIPLFFIHVNIGFRWSWPGGVISLVIGLTLMFTYIEKVEKLRLLFSKEAVLAQTQLQFEDMILFVFKVVSSAIFQEVYYRGFLFGLFLRVTNPIISTVIISGLFTFEHYYNPVLRKVYHRKGYIYHFMISMINSVLYLTSGSIWTCILVHLSFNGLQGVLYIYQYLVWKKYGTKMMITEMEL